jgi:hypothetical protein
MVRIELQRPVEHDGKRIEVIEYDADAVTAADLLAALDRAEEESAAGGGQASVGLRAMQALVARLAGVHYDALSKAHPADYAAAIGPVGPIFAPFLDLLAG